MQVLEIKDRAAAVQWRGDTMTMGAASRSGIRSSPQLPTSNRVQMNGLLSTIVEMSGGQEAKTAVVLREIQVDRMERKKGLGEDGFEEFGEPRRAGGRAALSRWRWIVGALCSNQDTGGWGRC